MMGAARRQMVVGLGIALACAAFAPAAPASGDRYKTIYHKGRSFRVPFHVDEADRPRLQEIQLWVSQDQGLRWEFYGHVPPDQPSFSFKATHDGEYWFTVRTKDTQGVLHPANSDQEVPPGLVVVVDTTPPVVTLRARTRRGSQASVGWEIADKNLDPSTLVLESEADGSHAWNRVAVARPALIGVASWDAGTADVVRVRATVADRAGNRASQELSLPEATSDDPSLAAGPEPSDISEPPPILPASSSGRRAASEPDPIVERSSDPAPTPSGDRPTPEDPSPEVSKPLLVGNSRFPLQYAVDDAGENGPEIVELWMTPDGGRTWTAMGRDPDRKSPFPVDLGAEGLFGLKLVARGASGLGDPPPVPGEAPQTLVDVDMSPPAVHLDPPKLNPSTGKLAISWKATDPHLGPRPVVLSYRPDRPDSIWQQIAGPIPNSGRFDWALAPNVAPRFLIRVDVLDSLGNRGSDESDPILVNRARPKSRIIGLDPSARSNGRALR